MSFRAFIASFSLLALFGLGLVACGQDHDHECETDADCPDGQMCHIEDGVEPHCMDMMGDDDDSAM